MGIHTNYCLGCMRSILINGVNSKNIPVFIKPNNIKMLYFPRLFGYNTREKSSVFRAWVGWGKENYKSFLTRAKARAKSRAQKITEARRVGTFGRLSVKAPRSHCEPSGARRANTMPFLENTFEFAHKQSTCFYVFDVFDVQY